MKRVVASVPNTTARSYTWALATCDVTLTGGFTFWLEIVNRFPVRDATIQHAMVCAFITSREYQERFSPVFTHSNTEADSKIATNTQCLVCSLPSYHAISSPGFY